MGKNILRFFMIAFLAIFMLGQAFSNMALANFQEIEGIRTNLDIELLETDNKKKGKTLRGEDWSVLSDKNQIEGQYYSDNILSKSTALENVNSLIELYEENIKRSSNDEQKSIELDKLSEAMKLRSDIERSIRSDVRDVKWREELTVNTGLASNLDKWQEKEIWAEAKTSYEALEAAQETRKNKEDKLEEAKNNRNKEEIEKATRELNEARKAESAAANDYQTKLKNKTTADKNEIKATEQLLRDKAISENPHLWLDAHSLDMDSVTSAAAVAALALNDQNMWMTAESKISQWQSSSNLSDSEKAKLPQVEKITQEEVDRLYDWEAWVIANAWESMKAIQAWIGSGNQESINAMKAIMDASNISGITDQNTKKQKQDQLKEEIQRLSDEQKKLIAPFITETWIPKVDNYSDFVDAVAKWDDQKLWELTRWAVWDVRAEQLNWNVQNAVNALVKSKSTAEWNKTPSRLEIVNVVHAEAKKAKAAERQRYIAEYTAENPEATEDQKNAAADAHMKSINQRILKETAAQVASALKYVGELNRAIAEELDPVIQDKKAQAKLEADANKLANDAGKAYDNGWNPTDITSFNFRIDSGNFTAGDNSLLKKDGQTSDQLIGVVITDIIQKMMIAFWTLALLIMMVWAAYIVMYQWQDELLSKGKWIFIAGLISIAISLASYYMVALIRFILYA